MAPLHHWLVKVGRRVERIAAGTRPDLWVRVDDRLIHGQVTVGWRQYLRYAEIWVVDDQARDDPYLQDALRLAAPEGVVVRVYGVEEAVGLGWPPPRSRRPRTNATGEGENAAPLAGARALSLPRRPTVFGGRYGGD